MEPNIYQLHSGRFQRPAGVVPAPANLAAAHLFPDVLTDIRHSAVIFAVEANSRREAQRPRLPIKNLVEARLGPVGRPFSPLCFASRLDGLLVARHFPSAGGHKPRNLIDKAVEVYGPVLVALGHKDVFQPLAPHLIIQPSVQLPGDLLDVVTVNLVLVKGQRDEPREIIAKCNVPHPRRRPAGRAGRVFVAGRAFCPPSFRGLGLRLGFFCRLGRFASLRRQGGKGPVLPFQLPALFSENGAVADQQLPRAGRVALYAPGVEDFSFFGSEIGGHDGILSLYQVERRGLEPGFFCRDLINYRLSVPSPFPCSTNQSTARWMNFGSG